MTNTLWESALSHLDQGMLEEFFAADAAMLSPAASTRQKTWRKRWYALVAAACCLFLLTCGIHIAARLDYQPFLASCGSYPGEIVAGDYYYFVPHRGVYCYDPDTGASRQVLHTFFADEYLVGAAGIFYESGLSVYLCDSGSGERRHLYTANPLDTTHIALEKMTTGDIAVTCYNKHKHTFYQVILHGMRGEILLITQPQQYPEIKYSEAHHSLGDWHDIELVPTDAKKEWQMDLLGNGTSLLPPGATVSKYSVMRIGLSLWFTVYYEDQPTHEISDYLVLHANGESHLYTLPYHPYVGGDGKHLFYPAYVNGVGCVEIATGESWLLETADDISDVYDIVTDGVYLYATAPWSEEQSLWQIERNEDGKPIAMHRITADITPK